MWFKSFVLYSPPSFVCVLVLLTHETPCLCIYLSDFILLLFFARIFLIFVAYLYAWVNLYFFCIEGISLGFVAYVCAWLSFFLLGRNILDFRCLYVCLNDFVFCILFFSSMIKMEGIKQEVISIHRFTNI